MLDAAPALVVETVAEPEAVPEPVIEAVPEGLGIDGLVAEDMERLEELLDEL